jgi:ABC-type glycerol-3-phosphate transport system substrate-binding protein
MGGTWLDAKSEKAAFASPQGIAALEQLTDLVRRRVAPYPFPELWTADANKDPRVEAFVFGSNGGVAMKLFNTFERVGVKKVMTYRWSVFLPPQQPKLASAQVSGNWFLVRGAKSRENGVALLLHASSAEEMAQWGVEVQRLPCYKSAVAHPIYQAFIKQNPDMQVHWDTAQGSFSDSPPIAGFDLNVVRKAIDDALKGTATPSAALQEAARVMDAGLERARGG